MPPDGFYLYQGSRWSRPLAALALYRDHRLGRRTLEPKHKLLTPLFDQGPRQTWDRAPGAWPREMLQAMRAHADPVADETVRAMFSRGDAADVHALMATLVTNDDPVPSGLPAEARRFFDETEELPDFADQALIAKAQRVFTNHGFGVGIALFVASLPQAYCAANGAAVLMQTRGLVGHTRRRILETAQFAFDVLLEGSFDPGGRAVRASKKVRLMHATIRHMILWRGQWDSDTLGIPINQADLAGTLLTFSVVVLDAFKKLGIGLGDEDEHAYHHTWNVVGHILGIDVMFLVHDVQDARALMHAIRRDQWSESEHGRQLAHSLMQSMEDYLPGGIVDDLPETLIRFVSGDHCADLLGLEGSDWTEFIAHATAALASTVGKVDPSKVVFRVMHHISIRIYEALIDVQREGKETTFRIPLDLVRSWPLED